MRATLVRIGNSRGIRIPKALLDQYGFGDTVEVEPLRDRLVLRPFRGARQGWAEAARQLALDKDDPDLRAWRRASHGWDRTEWEW